IESLPGNERRRSPARINGADGNPVPVFELFLWRYGFSVAGHDFWPAFLEVDQGEELTGGDRIFQLELFFTEPRLIDEGANNLDSDFHHFNFTPKWSLARELFELGAFFDFGGFFGQP